MHHYNDPLGHQRFFQQIFHHQMFIEGKSTFHNSIAVTEDEDHFHHEPKILKVWAHPYQRKEKTRDDLIRFRILEIVSSQSSDKIGGIEISLCQPAQQTSASHERVLLASVASLIRKVLVKNSTRMETSSWCVSQTSSSKETSSKFFERCWRKSGSTCEKRFLLFSWERPQ